MFVLFVFLASYKFSQNNNAYTLQFLLRYMYLYIPFQYYMYMYMYVVQDIDQWFFIA